MISAIVPSFKNPKCLEVCIKSFLDTQTTNSELICIIDGFVNMYEEMAEQYIDNPVVKFAVNQTNRGMPFSINLGAYYAINPWLLILNDDNVFPKNWDTILLNQMDKNKIISPNQIEKDKSIFNFTKYDFGTIDNFRYEDFLETEPTLRENTDLTKDGEIFPFCINKKLFMAVGGFDLVYPSPFVCDWDFFLKLELLGVEFFRTRKLNFYHFGSMATKKSSNLEDANHFKNSEHIASEVFAQKWGFEPIIQRPSNSHKPDSKEMIRGINYYEK
jgi:glycosyltransferase involved in cell wall biosynthesis